MRNLSEKLVIVEAVRERERERESYTLENGSKVLFVCLKSKIVNKYKDMMYLCNFGRTKII